MKMEGYGGGVRPPSLTERSQPARRKGCEGKLTVLDVVQADALNDRHVVGGEKTEDLRDFGDLRGRGQVEDVAALVNSSLQSAGSNRIVEGIGRVDLGLSEDCLARLVLETDEAVERHSGCAVRRGWVTAR